MREESATRGLRMAAVAARQHGVVAVRQLHEIGIDRSAVSRRVRDGRLHRVHRGVYAVGHPRLPAEGRWMAAILACGAGPEGSGPILRVWRAALSHRSAAELWELLPRVEAPVDVTRAGDSGRRRRGGIRLHRSRTIADRDVILRRGTPVTNLSRTIADLRAAVAPRLVRRAIRQAELFHGFEAADPSDRTRSDLERDFLRFCRRHRLPPPEVNARVGGLTVDFLWRRARLVVETDGYRYHRGSIAFEDDHLRELQLRRLGFSVRRYTGAQLRAHPAEIAAELDEFLKQGHRPS